MNFRPPQIKFRRFTLLLLAAVVSFCVSNPPATDAAPTNTPPAQPAPKKTVSASPAPDSPAAATNTAASGNFDTLDDKYRLVIGDQLSFQILEDEDDPVILPVTDSGEIQVPYLGRHPAKGKTCRELARGLKTELEKKYYYRATVVIAVNSKPRSRGKIYLVGAIRVPGPQEISSDETLTVSRAILRAGGFTEFAGDTKVKVTRGSADDKKVFTVDVSRILEKGDSEEDVPLQPGDLIYVPERMIRF
jgi:polysaccharide export outer membrane protein